MLVTVLKIAASAIIGYLCGSISSAVIVSRLFKKKDIRGMGSGNAGATNMARIFGWGAGIATFLCDALKTVGSMLLGRLVAGEYGLWASGLACLAGHCFPLYFGFRGGKGITVGAAIGFMLSPWMFLILVAVFAVSVAITRRVSAASLVCAVAFPVAGFLTGSKEPYQIICCVLVAALVIFMHRSNIVRLIKGTEPVFHAGGGKK